MQVDSIRGISSIGSVTSTTRRRAAGSFDVNSVTGSRLDEDAVTAVTGSSASHAYSEEDAETEPDSDSTIEVEA